MTDRNELINALQSIRYAVTAAKAGAPVMPALLKAEDQLMRILFDENEIVEYLAKRDEADGLDQVLPVFVAVCEDRHVDDVITVHATRELADEDVERFMDLYAADDACPEAAWHEQLCRAPWVRSVATGMDDGPKARIEETELSHD